MDVSLCHLVAFNSDYPKLRKSGCSTVGLVQYWFTHHHRPKQHISVSVLAWMHVIRIKIIVHYRRKHCSFAEIWKFMSVHIVKLFSWLIASVQVHLLSSIVWREWCSFVWVCKVQLNVGDSIWVAWDDSLELSEVWASYTCQDPFWWLCDEH